jgi:MoxR-like ATPase
MSEHERMSNAPHGSDMHSSGAHRPTIEFRCAGCGKLLKVGSTAAGRQAKCPECGSLSQVPAAGEGHAGSYPAAAGHGSIAPYGAAPRPVEAAWAPPRGDGGSAQPPAAAAGAASHGGAWTVAAPSQPAQDTHHVAAPGQWSQAATAAAPASAAPAPPAAPQTGFGMGPRPGIAPQPLGRSPHQQDTETKRLFDRITAEIAKIYVGQDELVLGTLVALFSSGHILIESVPGLGKTLFVRTLGRVLGCQYGRIQFTADLMPSDITGAPIFDMKSQDFRFRAGPVFTQFLLADEINRAPAKTHAALLEIMQEYRVTIDGVAHSIDRPFLVLATQNPIESEGTYNLPEAQLDRFMFKLLADYPAETEESEILKLHSRQVDINKRLEEELQPVTNPEEILRVTRANGEIRIDDKLIDYVNKIVRLTRHWPQFHMGASPRAGLALMQGSRTLASFSGRDYAVPDDVVQIALPALRHRVVLTAEAEVEGHKVDELLTDLIRSVEVPRL